MPKKIISYSIKKNLPKSQNPLFKTHGLTSVAGGSPKIDSSATTSSTNPSNNSGEMELPTVPSLILFSCMVLGKKKKK